MAAVSGSLLDGNYDNVDRTVYTTASISPAANSVLLLGTMLAAAGTAGTSVIADGSGDVGAWTTIAHDLDGGRSSGIFWALCGASPGSFTITNTPSGGDATHTGGAWFVWQITNHSNVTTIRQSVLGGGDGTNATAPTAALALAIEHASNRVFAFVSHRANEATSPRTNYTEPASGDFNANLPNMGWETQWRNDGTNEQTVGASWATSSRYQLWGVEVRSADADGAPAVEPYKWRRNRAGLYVSH